ncbi:MAG: hypothetical protein EBR01_12775 [Proteobacteria bacterium]|nr:hypothetical protein [Pseudomonadota bacterium]
MSKQKKFAEKITEKQKRPFMKWAECQKALKELEPLPPLEVRDEIIRRTRHSPFSRYLAFECLFLLFDIKMAPKLRWIEEPMLNILSGGEQGLSVSALTLQSDARKWISHQFNEVDSSEDWKKFISDGKHYWVLYGICKTFPNVQLATVALIAFSEYVERSQRLGKISKNKQRLSVSTDSQWLLTLLKSKIPINNADPKNFLELVYALRAIADLSAGLQSENELLKRDASNNEEKLTLETQRRQTEATRAQDLEQKLTVALGALEKINMELSEEKLHSERQGGYNNIAKQETIHHVLSIVRQRLVHRLENIRGYAEREKPNRERLLELISDVQKIVAGLESEVRQ